MPFWLRNIFCYLFLFQSREFSLFILAIPTWVIWFWFIYYGDFYSGSYSWAGFLFLLNGDFPSPFSLMRRLSVSFKWWFSFSILAHEKALGFFFMGAFLFSHDIILYLYLVLCRCYLLETRHLSCCCFLC